MKDILEMNLFLADNDAFCLHLYEQHLKKNGFFNIRTFYSGEDVLGKIKENPDVIFLDYDLGTINGLETLKKIKQYNPHIYVVMVSGQDDVQVIREAYHAGAYEFIKKGDSENIKMALALNKIGNIKKMLNYKSIS